MFPLPTAWTYETGLPPKARIPEFRDSAIPVISGTGAKIVYSSTPLYRSKEPVPVPRCCTGTFRYLDRPERPKHGLRQSHRQGRQGFRGVSTPSYLRLSQQISQPYRVCLCYLTYEQGYYLSLVHSIHSSLHQL